MAYTICALSGCPRVTETRYCTAHERAKDKARGTKAERGYDGKFFAIRRQWAEKHRTQALTCVRCELPIPIGETFHLDHDDEDRSKILGPAHPLCNTSAGGKASQRYT